MLSRQIKQPTTEMKHTPFSHRFFSMTKEFFMPHEKRGFLAKDNPLRTLPPHSPLNIRLNEITQDLPSLTKSKKLASTIIALNKQYQETLLVLNNPSEQYLALGMLTLINQAYIWETPERPKNLIPFILSNNLEMLSRSLQLPLILTYQFYVLRNWYLIDPEEGFVLENIKPVYTFTGTLDEEWFIKIHVAIEATCAPALRAAQDACFLNFGMRDDDGVLDDATTSILIQLFKKISESLNQAAKILLRMKEHCHPEFFYHTLRPFFGGWDEKLGIQFESNQRTYQYKGPSGAQSSILPALDDALGVEHKMDGMHQHALEFKQYMPREHVNFINQLKQLSIQLPANSSDHVVAALAEAIKAVQLFRFAHHRAIVETYIHRPAAKQDVNARNDIGSGGTPIDDFLETRRSNTRMLHSRL